MIPASGPALSGLFLQPERSRIQNPFDPEGSLRFSAALISGRTINLNGKKLMPPPMTATSAPCRFAVTARAPVVKRTWISFAKRVCIPKVPLDRVDGSAEAAACGANFVRSGSRMDSEEHWKNDPRRKNEISHSSSLVI